MKTISRYIMTLALLLTAVTGAWATDGVKITTTEIVPPAAWNKDYSGLLPSDMPGLKADAITEEQAKAWADVPKTGSVVLIYGYVDAGDWIDYNQINFTDGQVVLSTSSSLNHSSVYYNTNNNILKYYYATGIEGGIEVAWNASTKTGTFSMPGSDVVLTPIYAKAAAFATTGTEPEVKTLLPEAAEGVIAGTDASLIAEGTGIVAFAAASTDVTQGTLMYAIGTSATEAPALTAFSATVPTAENIADDGADVYVWYYIKGADTPDGQQATEENTFNDTEPACLTVQVLTNKFDIQFNAANANTIEAGKATVTVGGTAATVTEGKLESVKMGTEVKMTAKDGYKFRKVEVKKKAAAPSLNITNPVVGQIIGSDGKNYISGTLPTGVTPVAKICYVDGSNGLALALTDEGTKDWSTAMTTCAAHTPAFTGGTWKLANNDEWDNMIIAAGSYEDLRDGFSFVGGTNMEMGSYWSSTEIGSNKAWFYGFDEGDWYNDSKANDRLVRACLAF
ncbi:DUF1566 domain-containing protein [Prevotella sp. E13-27]|uniref:DUF1566 domain-containing protein n=1 Tax=Prevotella sp. E13-27 TaxID=2938122 RepID=UPI00200AB2DF|nr:DUF1566 domain-containing protein [Prevotella sp. E13-27]MCK8621579.1 DUF1566 domain-containing protein [Prevotella sp. E13-27]